MLVVLDTNIWISGLLLPNSIAGVVLASWRQTKFDVALSEAILLEIERVLLYPKIAKRLHWEEDQIEQYLTFLRFFSKIAPIDHIDVKVESDPHDSAILATLIASKADYLVTGDNDLLQLRDRHPIISLHDFHERLFI